jgi:hypothetical protein
MENYYNRGIYLDTSTKGVKGKRHNVYRSDITVNGIRRRKRSRDRRELEIWLMRLKDGRDTGDRST